MRRQVLTLVLIASCSGLVRAQALEPSGVPVIAIHGGAGTIPRGSLTPEREAEFRSVLAASTTAGQSVLLGGGSAVDAVVAAVKVMEDSPLFNAGKGAVFTSEARNELDASIMDGKGSRAGAVAGVRQVKNPIEAARAVMNKSRHVLFAGAGADSFAKAQGLEIVPESYFATEFRLKQLEGARKRQQIQLDHTPSAPSSPERKSDATHDFDSKFGTVGAVALDSKGNLAAATSTGGLTNKMPGRIGDSPLIGAGTYAENGVVAVSATGSGEMFIRSVAAYDVAARIKYARQSVLDAANATLGKIRTLEGSGGFILIDPTGEVTFAFNTTGMYRASARGTAAPSVSIYKDD